MIRYVVRLGILSTLCLSSCMSGDKGAGGTPVEQELCGPLAPNGRCAEGYLCFGGSCLAEAQLCGATNPSGLCAVSSTCLNSTCVANGDLCSNTNPLGMCVEGLTCRAGQCIVSTAFCSAANPSGLCADVTQTCVDGTCYGPSQVCGHGNPAGLCPTPLTCINESCAVNSPCTPLETLGYCSVGQTCIDGSCKNDADLCDSDNLIGLCRIGKTCVDGTCADDGLLCTPGNPAGLCASPSVCFSGRCVDPSGLCSPDNTHGLCTAGHRCDETGTCVDNGGCSCDVDETCLDGVCRANDVLCSMTNPVGLCTSGADCVAGECTDAGIGCSATNPAGICTVGELCEAGTCVPVDGASLCDDGNPCTLDYFDFAHNRCAHDARQSACSDGNACTTDACVVGVCVGTPIAGCIAPPSINPYVTPTNNSVLRLSGTKPAGSSVWINTLEAVAESPDTTWAVTLNLAPGENVYVTKSVDQSVESQTVTVRVIYDPVAPMTALSPAGGVFLNGVTVTVATDEPAVVYYTTDGGTPDEWSRHFESTRQFRVFDDTVLQFKARDLAGNWQASPTRATFEITGHNNYWGTGPSLTEPSTLVGATFAGDSVYVVGGSDGTAPQAGAYQYSMTSSAWTTMPSLPAGRAQLALVALGGKLYAIGGENVGAPKGTVTTLSPGVDTQWTSDTVMPTTRYGLAAVPYDGKIYVFGGKTNGNVVLDNLEVFTPGTPGTWANVVPGMPRPRYAFGAVEHKGLIFLVGGEDASGAPIATVDVYDPAHNTWAQVADLPTPRSFLAVSLSRNLGSVDSGYVGVVAAGGKGAGGVASPVVEEFVIDDGAWRSRKPLPASRFGAAAVGVDATGSVDSVDRVVWLVGGQLPGGLTSSVAVYHEEQDYVRRLADEPAARFMHAAAELNGRIFIFGGRNNQEEKTVWELDPETESFKVLPALATFQNGLAAAAVADEVYAIGGADSFGNSVATLRAYDPVVGAWQELVPMPTGRRDAAAAVVGDTIVLVGGFNDQALQTVEIYDTRTNAWTTGAALPAGRTGAMAVAHHGDIYLFGGRDNADAAIATPLRLRAGVWSPIGGSVPASYGSVFQIHDNQIDIFAGRDGASLTGRVWSYNVATELLTLPHMKSLLQPYDSSASAMVNGKVYLFGGNASVIVGPTGEARVQKVEGRCFNGIQDGRELRVDGEGGCGSAGYLHHTGTGITFYNANPPNTTSAARAIDACNKHYGDTSCAASSCGSAAPVVIRGGGCVCAAGTYRWLFGTTTSYGSGGNAGDVYTGSDACGSALAGHWD
jgi:N-acetylneuraminic acid mutarotase